MNRLITPLDSTEALNANLVGGKASKLALLLAQGVPIPRGFCVTTEVFQNFEERIESNEFQNELATSFYELINSIGPNGSLIVRSSANYEDSAEALFPGVFESTTNVQTLPNLIAAIRSCFSSLNQSKVLSYCKLKGINPQSLQMAALVQEYINPDWSGVALSEASTDSRKISGIYVEVLQGSAAMMLRGTESANGFLIRGSAMHPKILRLSRTQRPHDVDLSVLRRLVSIVEGIKRLMPDKPQIIEWVASGHRISIVQTRPLVSSDLIATIPKLSSTRSDNSQELEKLIDGSAHLGLKAAAMKLFCDMRWFTKSVLFIPPHASLKAIEQQFERAIFANTGLTVRFSYKGEIGLPRFFAKGKTEALDIVRLKKNPKWTAIVHEYMYVNHSFEIVVDYDRVVLEHVPGIWESESDVSPDVLINEHDTWTAYRVSSLRTASLKQPDGTLMMDVEPSTLKELYDWKNKVKNLSAEVRTRFKSVLPLNFHCVSENHDWQFLNVRTSGKIGLPGKLASRRFHIVSSPEDLNHWDGATPILLRLSPERGNEDCLADIIPNLPADDDLIFIDFGVLSHPAIMLRELGVNPTPVYLTHERIDLSNDTEGLDDRSRNH